MKSQLKHREIMAELKLLTARRSASQTDPKVVRELNQKITKLKMELNKL
jgi:hypothetical protein